MPASYNTYEKSTSVEWNGEMFVLTLRNEIGNLYTYSYSYDGVNWTNAVLPSNVPIQNPFCAKWLGDKFVLGGNIQINGSSTGNTSCLANVLNGTNRAALPGPAGNQIYDIETNAEYRNRIIFPRNTVLALGGVGADTTKIAYSTDQGITWTASTNSNTVFSVSANGAAWNGKLWAAVGTGAGNTLATSIDGGMFWISRGKTVFSASANAVEWSHAQNMFVAVGSGGNVVASSADGVYWLGRSANLFSSGNDVKWNGLIWVAAGVPVDANNKSLAYSYDGINWATPTQSNLFSTSAVKVAWNGSQWIAVGVDATNNMAFSQDGVNWNMANNSALTGVMRSVYADEENVVISTDSSFAILPQGSVGAQVVRSDVSCNAVFNIKSGYLFAGNAKVAITDSFATYANVSVSGISAVNALAWNTPRRGCTTIAPLTVACGSGNASLAYSADGIQWTAINNSIFTTRANKAVWNGRVWAAVGAGNYWVATSYDGLEWTGRNSALMTECYDIAWNGAAFVAVGEGSACMAASADGINWEAVSGAGAIFSTRASSIDWTGAAWIAYGSGTNTSAVSAAIDGKTGWAAAGLAITDASSALVLGSNVFSASSAQGSYPAANAFDGSFNATITEWYSGAGTYTSSTGAYAGSATTAYNGGGSSVAGEWIQLQVAASVVAKSVYLTFIVASGTAIPKQWTILGSNDGATWSLVSAFANSAATPPNNSWKYPFASFPVNLYSNTSAYSYYRAVFPQSYGQTYVAVADMNVFVDNANSKTLDVHLKPIMMKNAVLHPTQILSVDGVKLNIYQLTDLSCNVIANQYINGTYVKNVVYGASGSVITSNAYDGLRHVIGSAGGSLSYINNINSCGNFNIDTVYGSVALVSNLSAINSMCFNTNFLIFGGSGGSVITYGAIPYSSAFSAFSTNAGAIFTQVNGLASNSGYGMVVPQNTLYLRKSDKLSVVSAKSFNPAIVPETSISFVQYPV